MEKLALYLFSAAILGVIVGILTRKCFRVEFKPVFLNTFWGMLAIFGAVELMPYYKYVEMYALTMIFPGLITGLLNRFKFHETFRKGFWIAFLLPLGGWFVMVAGLVAKKTQNNVTHGYRTY